ncbi:Protein PAT1 homolog 1 [Caenorhabditis elegans]|uniref:Protein PAT1 homolog 1 n=1 Tax=Caenorhabditis elegans TaxID=6239 RepID=PATR1_CAEEL|nr:Protein PAT1 homolog 1 [Caenorhabditis elegans]Q20374.2 RecName: Full=Protein PAT1 homolog 1 [Caenorhabditis elegans]CAA90402.1 Protein PAT1 homolog 1 [Caenorhabditis elegans]|eukprot:NP_496514.1 Protein PAT1 homolog 1 [Caenorhabditis elegans]
MEEVKKYGKTLEEIEGGLMFDDFPESLVDSDEDHNIFDDEFDAANDETFGGGLDNIGENAELENYATQTAKLRFDDPVWQKPSSSDHVAPSASEIPIPFPNFGNGDASDSFKSSFEAESPFLKKSIWGNGTDGAYNIWGTNFGISSVPAAPTLDLDFGALLPTPTIQATKEVKSSQIPSMPSSALTLEDCERMQMGNKPDSLVDAFKDLQLGSTPVQPQSAQFSKHPLEARIAAPGTPATASSQALPTLPTAALSLEELELQIMKEAQILKGRQQVPSDMREDNKFSHPPPGFNQNVQPRMDPSLSPGGMHGMPPSMGTSMPHMGPMMPPQNMQLPRLPPLNPQFLPLIPVWFNAIINNIQLPMGVPPPPPFLFQLLNHYRNPQLVHAMIMQSSIPPNIRQNGPQFSHPSGPHSPGNRVQRKHSGMPSTRTIYDLALDSFAGYMSYKEREWLIRIQFIQCKGSGDPQVDDYYYVTWRDKQIANGWTAETKLEEATKEKKEKSSESQKDYLERISRMNYREMQKERARERDKERQRERQERIDRGEDKKLRQTLSDKFATSLGLPSKSSTHNPRHVLDMKAQVESVDNQTKKLSDEERKIAVAKKLRTMLLRLEGALNILMEVDELRRSSLPEKSQFKDLSSDEKDQEVEKRTTVIINELMGDDLSKLMQMSKGRAVITRTLKVVEPRDQARIILALMTAGGLVSKKMYGEIVLDILPVVYQKVSNLHPDQFKYLVGALNLDTLKRQLLDSNMFIRDMMMTLFFVSVKNNQQLVEWAKATKFSSLKMPSSAPLSIWRKALSVISDSEIKEFADDIKYSGIVDCHDVAQLIEQSL